MGKKSEDRPATVRELVNKLNKDLGFEGLQLASEAEGTFLVRRPCGIFSIDLATAGGLPAGTMCKIGGQEGLGKNYLADLYMRENQRIHGKESKLFIVSSEYPFDKLRARDNGLMISLTKKEIEQFEKSLKRELSKDEKKALRNQIGEIVVIQGLSMDETLETILELLKSNLFHIGLVDSMDSLIPEEQQDRDIGDARVGTAAGVQTDFMKRFHYAIGKNRRTLLLTLGQARANIPTTGRAFTKTVVNDPYAVKHGLAGKIVLSNGGPIRDTQSGPIMGKTIRWDIQKGKAGFHDGIRGEIQYRYETGVDLLRDFVETAKGYIPRGGAYYTIPTEHDTVRVNGLDAVAEHFRNNPNDMEYVRHWIYEQKGIAYMYDETEDKAGAGRPGGKKARKTSKR